ncbi:hypothetical protein CONPUDRAFT_137793 [Coniophora puteana RWD-64-598 SS2]|uniref:Microbial-type PARG catalytic domain-containing protein n=1 Tax=Coniophora puteana (strain RWD-64-598) TaxID=741705 RepID=A0A5M3MNN4_CONPW|nr:uncharacterized protein CONPUDRAFT_137793 [Coniophora puteana RWD-64-598 SS2]EIW80768.1 hypothetical protein CONPUDRAFT_137793 [Coniophora puteana RWD-64-598 SS2]
MVYKRKTTANRKHHRARVSRSATPAVTVSLAKRAKSTSTHGKSRRQTQRQKRYRQVKQRQSLRAQHQHWAEIARDTQRIILGDGKYFEEKSYSMSFASTASAASPSSGNSDGSLLAPRMPMDSSVTMAVAHDIGPHILISKQGTTFIPHTHPSLADWRKSSSPASLAKFTTTIDFTHSSTTAAARALLLQHPDLCTQPNRDLPKSSIGVLSFASPKRPGGGWLHGSNEQEEALARTSSLVASLQTDHAKEFYRTHREFLKIDGAGLHDHSMVYSPGVVVFRSDESVGTLSPCTSTQTRNKSPRRKKKSPSPAPAAATQPQEASSTTVPSASSISQSTFIPPFVVNVLSAVPVNAAAIKQTYSIDSSTAFVFEDGIRETMRTRMARSLRIFQMRGDRALILGAFGCGSSENRVEEVAELWAELLVTGERPRSTDDEAPRTPPAAGDDVEGRRVFERHGPVFKDVFEHIVFAVPGKLFEPFKRAFEMRLLEAQLSDAITCE